MQTKLISVTPQTTISVAITKMKKSKISQMPVMQGTHCIGLVSEAIILDALLHNKQGTVKDIMGECPPIVNPSSPVDLVSELLTVYPTVLIAEQGEAQGHCHKI